MSWRSAGRVLAGIAAPFGRRGGGRGAADADYVGLARRVEERGYLASLEAQAYVDQRIDALRAAPSETGRHIEERALLASQEARAYADSAIESLGMALRGVSKVVVRLSRRLDALEQQEPRALRLSERLTRAERGLAALHDRALASRAGELAAEMDLLSHSLDEGGRLDPVGRQRVNRIDAALRNLAADLGEIDGMWRDSADPAGGSAGQDDQERLS